MFQLYYVGEVSGEEDNGSLATAISDCKYQLIFIRPESLLCNKTWREVLQGMEYYLFQKSLDLILVIKKNLGDKNSGG